MIPLIIAFAFVTRHERALILVLDFKYLPLDPASTVNEGTC